MPEVSTSYSLRSFQGSKDKDFVQALSIYSKYAHSSTRTDTREITYWLDNYGNEAGDKFYVTGFYVGEVLVGYAEFAYIRGDRLLIFDYLIIEKGYRKNNVFFEFVEHLRRFVEYERLEFKYAVAEVGYLSYGTTPSEQCQQLVRLFKTAGGKVVRAPYYQPRLGVDDYESEMPAVLMLFSNSDVEQIPRATFISIVKCIYYKHYVRWFSIHKETAEPYRESIDVLIKKIEKETDKMKTVRLNGQKPLPDESSGPPVPREARILNFAIPSLLFVVLLTYFMLRLREIYDISILAVAFLYLLALVSFFSVMSVFSKNAMKVFSKLLVVLKVFSRRIK
jgi:hypothetical protein